jgi:hypothetical protein
MGVPLQWEFQYKGSSNTMGVPKQGEFQYNGSSNTRGVPKQGEFQTPIVLRFSKCFGNYRKVRFSLNNRLVGPINTTVKVNSRKNVITH